MTHDLPEILRALRLIVQPGQVTELRALNVRTPTYRAPHTESGYFDTADALAAAAMTLTDAPGLYIVPNQVDPSLLARACNRLHPAGKGDATTSDHNIIQRRWLLVDIDAIRPAGISSSDAEHNAALNRAVEAREWLMENLGFEEPIFADSGNGAHLMFLIDLPTDDGGLIEACLQALAAKWDDVVVAVDLTVFNPARIWKLYGTVSRKGDSIAVRPHRLSKIIYAPSSAELFTTPTARLQTLAALAPAKVTARLASNGFADAFAWLDRWLVSNAVPVHPPSAWRDGRIFTFDICPFNPDHTNNSAFITQGAGGPIGAGCHHAGCKALAWGWRELRAKFEPQPRRGQAKAFKLNLAMELALNDSN